APRPRLRGRGRGPDRGGGGPPLRGRRGAGAAAGGRGMSSHALGAPPLDVVAIRRDFPALDQTVHGRRLVYLDSAATSQKPRQVLDALRAYYETDNANVHRGVHSRSQRATDAYEAGRRRVQRFLNAAEAREIVFVRGATEGINLVAATFGRMRVSAGDEVL